ncbi:Flp family type IVb pilin [bacterium]|nr:Flp family type IVb pilin [bacterium]
MKKMLKKLVVEEEAQGMVEYILIIAVVALVVIGSIRLFGSRLSTLFTEKADELVDQANPK